MKRATGHWSLLPSEEVAAREAQRRRERRGFGLAIGALAGFALLRWWGLL